MNGSNILEGSFALSFIVIRFQLLKIILTCILWIDLHSMLFGVIKTLDKVYVD